MSNVPTGSPVKCSSRAHRLQQSGASPAAAAAAHARRPKTTSPPPRDLDPAFQGLLDTLVFAEAYQAATGPDGKGAHFTRSRMHAAFVYTTVCIGVIGLYPAQISCLLALFLGRHVFCLMATRFGKTFAYECLPMLYDYLYNGDHRLPTYRRVFCPVIFIINPLCSLMIEQTNAFNNMASKAKLALRAAHLSSEQKEPQVFVRVADRDPSIAIIHTSIEVLVEPKKPYRGNLVR